MPVEEARTVTVGGKSFPVRRTSRSRLREVDFQFEDHELRGLEQNPKPLLVGRDWHGKEQRSCSFSLAKGRLNRVTRRTGIKLRRNEYRELVPNEPRVIKPSRFVSQVHWIKCRTESCSFTGMLVSPVAPLRMSELVQTRIGQNFASP
jgi:hypothetical protein